MADTQPYGGPSPGIKDAGTPEQWGLDMSKPRDAYLWNEYQNSQAKKNYVFHRNEGGYFRDFKAWREHPEGQSADKFSVQKFGGSLDPAEDALAGKQADYEAQLDAFYRHMTGPLDPNDPEVKAQTQIASNVAQRVAKLRGIKGGVVPSEVGRNVAAAHTNMQSQRQQLGLAALGMKGKNVSNLQGLAVAQQDKAYELEADKAGGLGATIGGIGGGIAGGIATAYTGNPTFLAGGISAGTSLGAAAGRSTVSRRPLGKVGSYSGQGY